MQTFFLKDGTSHQVLYKNGNKIKHPNTGDVEGASSDLLSGMIDKIKKTFEDNKKKFDEKIPFLHISGDQDKVNSDGAQAENIHNLLIESGFKSELKKFKGMRHEPFQEKKRQKVFESVLDFYLSNI